MDDDARIYQAIGEVAVAAATLEYHLALIVAIARGEADDKTLTWSLEKVGRLNTRLGDLVDDVPEGSDFGRRLRRVKRAADSARAERGSLLHSVALVDDVEGRTLGSFWHPGTDTEAPIDLEYIKALARDLYTVSREALRLARRADEWHPASARPGGAPDRVSAGQDPGGGRVGL